MKELCLGGDSFKLTNELITQENFPVLESLALRGTSQNSMDIDDRIIRNIQIMSVTSLREVEFHFCRYVMALQVMTHYYQRKFFGPVFMVHLFPVIHGG